jgi:molybdenum cofactor biosynthesis protein B
MTGHHDGHAAPGGRSRSVAFGLLTVSDTRREDNDLSGQTMRRLVEASGHRVQIAAIVPDDPESVRERILAWALDARCEAIVTSGGTGLSARDHTVEAACGLFDIRIDGFGELFRQLSFQHLGARAMLSRAAAGVVRGTPVFLLPGSPAAVTLALESLVLPTIGHLMGELTRHGPRA